MRKKESLRRIYGLMAVGIVFTLLMGYLPLSSVQGEKGNCFMKEVGTENEIFGGGEIIKIRFGDDAWFGVIYGTEENPNSITIVSMARRYLGVAEVYDRSGGKVSSNYPIRIQSLFAMRLENILEFNDTNSNGICDYQRYGDGLDSGDFYLHEPIYKAVSLKAAWEKSEIIKTEEDNSTTWEFSLTARDLPYREIGKVNTTDKVLEKVMFKFRLTSYVQDVNTNVPVYNIQIRKMGDNEHERNGEHEEVISSTHERNRTYRGKVLRYSTKVDHDIEGWDFEENNTNPHLLLETRSIVGYRIPTGVAKWMREHFVSEINGGGRMKYSDENGTTQCINEHNAPSNENMSENPRRLKNPRIELTDNWERVGVLSWLTNVTLENNGTTSEGEMYFQIQGHRSFQMSGYAGLAHYRGFYLRGGFSYPAAERVYHDPTMESEITILDIQSSTGSEDEIPAFEGVLGILAMVGTASVIFLRRKR